MQAEHVLVEASTVCEVSTAGTSVLVLLAVELV